MLRPRVYLAGHITGLSYSDSVDWREKAIVEFKKRGIAAYSPMRAKEFMAKHSTLPSIAHDSTDPFASPKGIMARDHHDCIKADALLVNFNDDARSLGTAMELAWAYDRHIPTVVVANPDNVHLKHPMVIEAVKYRVDTIEEGMAVIESILLPEGPA